MSLWWAKRDQLDPNQVKLIEELPLDGNNLVVGPPGSGKTNILLRRAQYARMQGRPNVTVLTFTRPLTEFLRTGCFAGDGRELFPPALLNTYESWQREIHRHNNVPLPDEGLGFEERKRELAKSTLAVLKNNAIPKYDALFVDEAQDLLDEEIDLILAVSNNVFCVGDEHQKIYSNVSGLSVLRAKVPRLAEHKLPFHYRLAPEICEVADRIQVSSGVGTLSDTQQYQGPRPGRVDVHGPLPRAEQVARAVASLQDQIRVYGDLVRDGDKLGVIVPRQSDRDDVLRLLDADAGLAGLGQIVRARGAEGDRGFNPTIDPSKPILILSVKGAKGLEFRSVQWLFADDLENVFTPEVYYTVVTRAKTSLDIYFTSKLPKELAKAHAKTGASIW